MPIKKAKNKLTSDASVVGSKVEPRLRGIYVDSDDGANDNSEWIFLFVISAKSLPTLTPADSWSHQ